MKLVDQAYLGAINFTGDEMQPIKRKLTISHVKGEIPPGAGKGSPAKNCIYFKETPKGAFLSTKQLKTIANALMCSDTDKWSGAVLEMTCAEVKARGGGMTMGMIVLNVTKPAKPGPATTTQQATTPAKKPTELEMTAEEFDANR
jgi:hypothetical protein